MIYKAKPKPHNYGRYGYDWLVDLLDDEGYVQGYYVDGYIVGDIAEVTEDYIHLEYWVPIEKDTLTQIKDNSDNVRLGGANNAKNQQRRV